MAKHFKYYTLPELKKLLKTGDLYGEGRDDLTPTDRKLLKEEIRDRKNEKNIPRAFRHTHPPRRTKCPVCGV